MKLRCKDSGRNPTRRVRDGSLAPLTPLLRQKTASGHFQCGKRSWLWRAVWSRPSMTRSRPLPASAMPRRRCYLRRSIATEQPDGRLCHRNRPFVLVGATDWVCPHPGPCTTSEGTARGGKGLLPFLSSSARLHIRTAIRPTCASARSAASYRRIVRCQLAPRLEFCSPPAPRTPLPARCPDWCNRAGRAWR